LADAVLQLAAIPLLLLSLWRLQGAPSRLNWPLAFCLALVAVPLVQLIPLPPQLWTGLPLRDLTVQSLTLAGHDIGWRPLSLTPHATWQSLGALIPPIAIFVSVLLLSWRDRRRLVLGLLGLGLVSGFVGMVQVALGPGAPPIGFGLGTPGEATGFFANRNHFAALLYSLLLFAAAFAINSAKSLPPGSFKSWESRALVAVVISFTVLVALLAAQMMARSRAGIGLTIVALLGFAALATSDDRRTSGLGVKRLVGAAVALVLLFASQFALYRVLERFEADPLADARLTFARKTWEAAWTLMPFGSGLGSFVPVYQFFEGPRDALSDVFANRAHNDVLEVWLETGMVGLVLLALFAGRLFAKLWKIWLKPEQGGTPLDQLLMRAASLIVVLLFAHSLVDYPLRTTAMMAVLAIACGLLFEPVGARREENVGWEDGPGLSEGRAGATLTGSDVPAPQARSVTREPGPVPSGDTERRSAPGKSAAEGAARADRVPTRQTWVWPVEAPSDTGTGDTRPEPVRQRSTPDAPSKGGTWGADMDWPEAWRAPSDATKRREGSEED
jgi:O-antigen ligase